MPKDTQLGGDSAWNWGQFDTKASGSNHLEILPSVALVCFCFSSGQRNRAGSEELREGETKTQEEVCPWAGAWEAPRCRRRASSRNGKEGRGEEAIETHSAQAQHLQNGQREGQGPHRHEKEPRATATLGPAGRASIWFLPTKIVTYAY